MRRYTKGERKAHPPRRRGGQPLGRLCHRVEDPLPRPRLVPPASKGEMRTLGAVGPRPFCCSSQRPLAQWPTNVASSVRSDSRCRVSMSYNDGPRRRYRGINSDEERNKADAQAPQATAKSRGSCNNKPKIGASGTYFRRLRHEHQDVSAAESVGLGRWSKPRRSIMRGRMPVTIWAQAILPQTAGSASPTRDIAS